jgi:hypothetical protein
MQYISTPCNVWIDICLTFARECPGISHPWGLFFWGIFPVGQRGQGLSEQGDSVA